MSIVVACQCGKRFKAGDQYAGKRTKCPGCGQPLTIPSAATPPPKPATESDDLFSLAEPAQQAEVFQPAARVDVPRKPGKASKVSAAAAVAPSGRRAQQGSSAVPSITLSPMVIVMIVLVILIPSAIYWAKEGPMKANADWKKISAVAEDNIDGQITRAMGFQLKQLGFDPSDIKYHPHAGSMFFDEPILMFHVPDSINFQGNSTEGMFHGVFHPKTWEFEVTVPIMKADHQVTGNASETDQSLELDSVPVKD